LPQFFFFIIGCFETLPQLVLINHFNTMRTVFSFILFASFPFTMFGQSNLQTELVRELDSMLRMDRKYRTLLILQRGGKRDSLSRHFNVKQEDLENYLWKLQKEVDNSNLNRVEAIIQEYGYPGMSMVGAPTNEAVFYIIQHSPKIEQYLPLIKKAAEEFELSFSLYAMMLDRSLVQKDQEQLYGTQAVGIEIPNPKTGKRELTMIIWPIKDAANVNKRRADAGFDDTVEEYALQLIGREYKIYTLEEVLRYQQL
jgi:hypothetical protein